MYFDDHKNDPVSPSEAETGPIPQQDNPNSSGEYRFSRDNGSEQSGTSDFAQDSGYTQPDAASNSGEYHFTRDNNPGEGSFNARDRYQAQPNTGYQSNRYQNPQGGYYQGYQPNFDASGYGAPYDQTGAHARKPKEKKKSGMGAGVIALALVCALVGGLVGGGAVYGISGGGLRGSGHATISASDRTGGVTTETVPVKAGEHMTPAQTYSTYGSAVVSVSVTTRQGEGAGTGFIIDGKEGYLLTCYHVIDGASAISVTLTDSTSFPAKYVGGDDSQDVAVLKITPEEGQTLDLNSVVLGDSSLLAVGDEVSAIGNALGTLANTLTSGHVSALDRAISMSDGTVMNLLQTDTTINSGNSGGPLFNEYGEVIGIVNAKYSSSSAQSGAASIEGIGFAIPINDVTEIMDDLMKHGYITGKPYLGISVATVSAVAAQQYADMVVGAYVSAVNEGSCAEKAGLKVGDIITQADNTDITTSAELIDIKNGHKAGEELILTVYRDKNYTTLKVTLDEEKPAESPIDDGSKQDNNSNNNNGGSYDYGYSWPFGYGNGGSNGSSSNSFGGFGWPFGW